METCTADSLAQFCIAQCNAFDFDDWCLRLEHDGEAVALAARYLSMTNWYGHVEELEHIASMTQGIADHNRGLYRESQVIGFDLPYFSSKVQLGVDPARRGQETYP